MPSKRKQLNIRLSEENEQRLESLVVRIRAALGINVSKSDVIQAGLVELEKKYPPTPETADLERKPSRRILYDNPPPEPPPKPRGRPRKEK